MRDGQRTTSEDRATQLLICEALSLANSLLDVLGFKVPLVLADQVERIFDPYFSNSVLGAVDYL